MRRLQNRVAVVTGAGSGIGRGLAHTFADRGCRLAIQDVNPERIGEVADALKSRGVEVLYEAFDVSDADAMAAFAERVRVEQGGAHIVVNNAGVSLSGDFLDLSLEDWEWIVGINLWGVVHGSRNFLPQLLEQDEGHLVNISSIFGVIAIPSQSAYCATKFAVRGLTETLRIELANTNVGVTSVHPGAINTNIVVDSRHNFGDKEARRTRKILEKGMDPARAAQHIVRAIERNQVRLRIGKDALWLDRMVRAIPSRYHDLVRRYSKRLSQ